jgi:hypothetical protein
MPTTTETTNAQGRVIVHGRPDVVRDRRVVGDERPVLVDEEQEEDPEQGGDQLGKEVAQRLHRKMNGVESWWLRSLVAS